MATPAKPDVTLAILAGGRGSRLGGVDKASLIVGGHTLLERMLRGTARHVRPEVIVVANDDRLAGHPRLRVIRDPDPHAGVLPALLAALDTAPSPYLLLTACDMPFVHPDTVAYLVARVEQHDAVVPDVGGYLQPMLAVYRVEPCRAAIRAALARSDRRMVSFLDGVDTLRVEETELRAVDADLRSFFNINTPADLEAARRIAGDTVSN